MSRQLARSANRAPRYRTLADTLAREVRADYRPGDLLPPELELARRFKVNRHTVRRALDELVAAGMVTRHQGRGTQVVDRRLDYAVSAGSKVTQNLAALGIATQTRCLEQGLREPPESIAQRFGRRPGEPLLCGGHAVRLELAVRVDMPGRRCGRGLGVCRGQKVEDPGVIFRAEALMDLVCSRGQHLLQLA